MQRFLEQRVTTRHPDATANSYSKRNAAHKNASAEKFRKRKKQNKKRKQKGNDIHIALLYRCILLVYNRPQPRPPAEELYSTNPLRPHSNPGALMEHSRGNVHSGQFLE
jgi:hypothetical protein